MLSRHSEVAVLCEDQHYGVLNNMGHTYSANKLIACKQIRMNRKASSFGHLINKVINFDVKGNKYHVHRPEPSCKMSVQQYLDLGAKVTCMYRIMEDQIESVVSRTGMDHHVASYEIKKGYELMEKIPYDKKINIHLEDLKENTEYNLKVVCHYLELQYEERMLTGTNWTKVYPEYYAKQVLGSNNGQPKSIQKAEG